MVIRRTAITSDAAEGIAIQALGFIAADTTLLPRFLSVTGIEAGQIRAAASEPGFLAGTLDFILAHEPTLMAFAEAGELDPASIQQARDALPFGTQSYDRSI